jgi:L-idonate 5-dehydrogenase
VLTVAVARLAGAAEVMVTDILDAPLAIAGRMGASRTANVHADPKALDAYEAEKGFFDVMFEAAGSPATLLSGLRVVRPQGIVVQIGQGAEATLPMSLIVTKELELRGTFRFGPEFATAASLLSERRIDVRPLLTESVPVSDAVRAFELASDKLRSMKVHIAFS